MCQISIRYLNPWLSYYYFRFEETNGRYIGILLPVLLLLQNTINVVLHWSTKSHRNRIIGGEDMTSYRFFKMAAVHHIGFVCGKGRPPTKCNCWSLSWSYFILRFRFNSICRFLYFGVLETAHSFPLSGYFP